MRCGSVGDKRRNVSTSKELAEIQLDNFFVIDSNMYSSKVISMIILKRKLLKLVMNERIPRLSPTLRYRVLSEDSSESPMFSLQLLLAVAVDRRPT